MLRVSINQTIALAGLYQSLTLLQQVAWDGESNHSCMLPTLESVTKLDIKDYLEAYGSIQSLSLGLRSLRDTLDNRQDSRVIERTRYAINLMYLETMFQSSPSTMSSLGNQIERIKNIDYENYEEGLAEELGYLYREYISPLGPKIIVEGNPSYLKTDKYAHLIRALLLAGLRAIVLWKQANGKRWVLLFARNSILKNIKILESS